MKMCNQSRFIQGNPQFQEQDDLSLLASLSNHSWLYLVEAFEERILNTYPRGNSRSILLYHYPLPPSLEYCHFLANF